MREVLVDGLRIAYSDVGTGPPLVLPAVGVPEFRGWN